MFDLSQVPMDAPLPFIAVAVLYNLARHAINLHHERKKEQGDAEIQERIVKLTAELAEAKAELRLLREMIKKQGA